MGQALYRKYRSHDWDSLVGQSHIVATLENAVKSGRFGHAYLFSGPRGVGKTSVARILARKINGLSYESDAPHIDIIEIDAASNTSVEDIRDLREKVAIAPSLAPFKVYIIDEVHMLSKSAFNALLKTLEEPPAHVIFVLATTDPQKVPSTIISRTQHFVFSAITQEIVSEKLAQIAGQEKISITPEALALVAELGEGSMRDSLSLLDQLAAGGQQITRSTVEQLVGLPPAEIVEQIIKLVSLAEIKKLVEVLKNARVQGFRAVALAAQLGKSAEQMALSSANPSWLELSRQLLDVPTSLKPDQLLEIILIGAAFGFKKVNQLAVAPPVISQTPKDTGSNTPQTSPVKATLTHKEAPSAALAKKPLPDTNKEELANPIPEIAKSLSKPAKTGQNATASELWDSVLDKLRGHHNTLYGVARMAKPNYDGGKLTLGFEFPFHLKHVAETRNLTIIRQLLDDLTGHSNIIECKLADRDSLPTTPSKADAGNLGNINKIFGGSELLE